MYCLYMMSFHRVCSRLTYQSSLVIGRIGTLPTYPHRGRAVAGKSEACESDQLPEQTDRSVYGLFHALSSLLDRYRIHGY